MVNSENLLWNFSDDDPAVSVSNTGASHRLTPTGRRGKLRIEKPTSIVRDGILNPVVEDYLNARQDALPLDIPKSSMSGRRRARPDNRTWLPVSENAGMDPDVARGLAQSGDSRKLVYHEDELGWDRVGDFVRIAREGFDAKRDGRPNLADPEPTPLLRRMLDQAKTQPRTDE